MGKTGDAPKENLSVPNNNEASKSEFPKLDTAQEALIYATLTVQDKAFVDSLKSPEDKSAYYSEVAALREKMAAKRADLAKRRTGVDPTANWDADPSGNMLG